MPTILLIEAEEGFAKTVTNGLAALNCRTEVATDGRSGLNLAETLVPDLVLVTAEIPKMNGFSVCHRLKRDANLSKVPVIILSANASEETFAQHRRLENKRANAYVHKPVDFGQLLETIREFLDLPGGGASSAPVDTERDGHRPVARQSETGSSTPQPEYADLSLNLADSSPSPPPVPELTELASDAISEVIEESASVQRSPLPTMDLEELGAEELEELTAQFSPADTSSDTENTPSDARDSETPLLSQEVTETAVTPEFLPPESTPPRPASDSESELIVEAVLAELTPEPRTPSSRMPSAISAPPPVQVEQESTSVIPRADGPGCSEDDVEILREERDDASQRAAALERQQERSDQRLSQLLDRIAELEQALEQKVSTPPPAAEDSDALARERESSQRLREELSQSASENRELQTELDLLKEQKTELVTRNAQLELSSRDASEKLERARAVQLDRATEGAQTIELLEATKTRLKETQEAQQVLNGERARLQSELNAAQAEVQNQAARIQELREALAQARLDVEKHQESAAAESVKAPPDQDELEAAHAQTRLAQRKAAELELKLQRASHLLNETEEQLDASQGHLAVALEAKEAQESVLRQVRELLAAV